MIDYLARQPYIDLLKSIIANRSNNTSGYSFAIDGEWGCGKTWILTELECQLAENSDIRYLIFHYNAWENDFYEEPLVAILSVMIEKLNKVTSQKSLYEAAIDELLRQASADLLTLVSGIVKEVTKIDAEKIIKRKNGFFRRIIESTKISAKEINTLIPLQHTLYEVRNNLKKLSEKFHIILVVDELDRCLPEYAIKVLERLHHICNEMPIIQILAIDKTNLADSICKVFGKDFSENQNKPAWRKKFAENYLQKFVDVMIPLPNGKPDKRLEILNGLERLYSLYIRKNMSEQEFIRLDDEFLANFISSLMNKVERRLQEKIFKQVELCHKLTINSGVKLDKEQMTYAILIYEIISCIDRYVFHHSDTSKLHYSNTVYSLEFFSDGFMSNNRPFESENKQLNNNLKNYFSCAEQKNNCAQRNPLESFKIYDTKSYVMAYFTNKPSFDVFSLESKIWDWIQEDKIFLQKYDEIMNTITAK